MSRRFTLSVGVLLALIGNVSHAAFVTPDSATPPFEAWARLDADSTYAQWNTFASGHSNPNAPDVGSFGPAGAAVVQTHTSAFITSGGNIYSFAAPTDFDVTLPNYGYGAGYKTRVVARIGTQGTSLLESSLSLTFAGSGGTETAPLTSTTYVDAPNPAGGTFGEWTVVWDVPNYNPGSFLLEFKASGSSMSLDRLAVDAFTQAVPEPAGVALIGACASVLPLARRRK